MFVSGFVDCVANLGQSETVRGVWRSDVRSDVVVEIFRWPKLGSPACVACRRVLLLHFLRMQNFIWPPGQHYLLQTHDVECEAVRELAPWRNFLSRNLKTIMLWNPKKISLCVLILGWVYFHPDEIKYLIRIMAFVVAPCNCDIMSLFISPNGFRLNLKCLEEVMQQPWWSLEAQYLKQVKQEDPTPWHTNRRTQSWLSENFCDHIIPNIWTPKSPDCNPLQYCGVQLNERPTKLRATSKMNWRQR